MPAVASIRFTQGANTDAAGNAVVGTVAAVDGPCQVTNGDNTDVTSWQIVLLDAPPASTSYPPSSNPQVLASASTATPSVSFSPDVPGTYRVLLDVVDGAGVRNRDIRCFGVPDARGFIVPPFQRNPDPLPRLLPAIITNITDPSVKNDEQNYGGQARGWAGESTADGQFQTFFTTYKDNATQVVSSTPFAAPASGVDLILVSTTTIGGASVVNLPATARVNQQFEIVDAQDDAASNPVTINLPGGHSFPDASSSAVIDADGAFVRVQRVGATSWVRLNVVAVQALGGSDTHVQYNNAGAFGGNADFIYDGTNVTLGNNLFADGGVDRSTAAALVLGGTNATSVDVTPPVALIERGADPGATANQGKLYTKDDAGVTELFFQASDGTVTQLTPAAAVPLPSSPPDDNEVLRWDTSGPGGLQGSSLLLDDAGNLSELSSLSFVNGANPPASAGTIRLPNAGSIFFRNSADSADLLMVRSNGDDLAVGYPVTITQTGSNAALTVVNSGGVNPQVLRGTNGAVVAKFQMLTSSVILGTESAHDFSIYTTNTPRATFSSTVMEVTVPTLRFSSAVLSPTIRQHDDNTASAVGDMLTVQAQSCGGAGSTGGDLHIRPGGGLANNGELVLQDGDGDYRVLIQDDGDLYLNGGSGAGLILQVQTAEVLRFRTSEARFSTDINFVEGKVNPVFNQRSTATPSAVGNTFQIIAQSCTGAGSTGGDLHFRPGSGLAAGGELVLQDSGGTGRVVVSSGGNVSLVAAAANYQSMSRGVFLGNVTTAPTGNPAAGGFLYAEAGALRWRGSAGTVSVIAPA